MQDPTDLSHRQYVAERRAHDPEFAAAYDEVRATMDLALALADLRERRGLSQRGLAEKSGIKQPMISRIERGAQLPKPITLLRLLAALNGVLTMLPDGIFRVRPIEAVPPPEESEVRDTALVASADGEIRSTAGDRLAP